MSALPLPPSMTTRQAATALTLVAIVLLAVASLGNAGIIFAILVTLMLTGMPISIALGLTVLTFLFFMTKVPIEAVGLKLFTGIEKFEIMAVAFFILPGHFLTRGGDAPPMIEFATCLSGHFPCGPAPGGQGAAT